MPNSYGIDIPTKVIFGPGRLRELGEISSGLGKKAFVIMDPFLRDSKIAGQVLDGLRKNGVKFKEWYDVVSNPRAETIDAAAELARTENCDHVVALGGGSSLDSAKAVCIVATNAGSSWDYTIREGTTVPEITHPVLPLLTIPTTAGTGSEVTPYAVVSNPKETMKATIADRRIFPAVSLVDPELHISKPKALTASTGLDAFAHAFEAFISIHSNPWTDTLALESIRLFARSIETCCSDGKNLEARVQMAESCYLAGIALGHIGVTLPHVIGQALGALKDAPHGAAVAAATVEVVRWTLPVASEKLAQVAAVLDPNVTKLPMEEQAARLPDILTSLYARIGVTDTFTTFGLTNEEVENLADVAFKAFERDVERHPKLATHSDVIDITRKCL